MDTELTRSSIKGDKFYLGKLEFTNLAKRLIRAYRYRNNNRSPEAIVIPNIKEVDGVKIEFVGDDIGISEQGTGSTGRSDS